MELEIVLKLLPLVETESMETHAGIITELEKDLPSLSEDSGRSMTADLMPLIKKIENVLTMMGLDGQTCILRAVCEMSSTPHIQPLGLSGEMLHVLFRYFISSEYNGRNEVEQSSSDSRNAYIDAGVRGRTGTICSLHFSTCPISVFNLATHPSC
ncbi:unnamed protein product [Meganyctiphanes norvegica]|uniref:Uncharacterized protein n=1 Tax=Meganyctiphanes norvegica TaxID=48144 RepID=A0AAV2SLU6_MEGNR